jgi:hypothetical protein
VFRFHCLDSITWHCSKINSTGIFHGTQSAILLTSALRLRSFVEIFVKPEKCGCSTNDASIKNGNR